MFTRTLLATAFTLAVAIPGFGQTSWQYQFKKGQTFTYKIKHLTSVTEVVDDKVNTTTSNLEVVNRWEVADVDSKGMAKLNLTLVSMRNEQKRSNGDVLLFDSTNLDKSTPELRESMKKFIGQTVASLRIDQHGRVLEVTQGTPATFETEPPFLLVFPVAKAAAGQVWRRQYNIILDPPYGTGEKFEAEQRFECTKLEAGKATVGVTTSFRNAPENPRERLPLLQKDVQGEIIFDVTNGRLVSANLNIDKKIENHEGKGSSYHFKSEYTRVLTD
jgi:hypothetical protein